jgi:hypothetical protein
MVGNVFNSKQWSQKAQGCLRYLNSLVLGSLDADILYRMLLIILLEK